MPKSSGTLRSSLGRARGVAVKHIDRYKSLCHANPRPWNDEATVLMSGILKSMQNDAEQMDELWKRWQKYVDSVDGDNEQEEEQKLFNEWRDNSEYTDLMFELDESIQIVKAGLEIIFNPVDRSSVASTQGDNQDFFDDILGEPEAPIAKEKKPSCKYIATPIPPLFIPKFKGDYMEWDGFWQRFNYAVHSKAYPKIEKLFALLNLLDGRAKEAVSGFQLSDKNYDTVVKTLVDRYDDKHAIISELQIRLRSMEPAKDDPSSIRRVVDSVKNICRKLENQGSSIDNEPMRLDIMDRMPPELKKKLYWFNRSTNATTDEILEKMEKLALKAETVPPSPKPTSSKSIEISKQTIVRSSWETNPISCKFCDGSHKPSKCRSFPTPEARIQQLKKKKCCVNCMSDDHMATNCSRKDLKCFNCNNPHFSFLCLKSIGKNDSKTMISVNKNQSAMMAKKVLVSHPCNDTVLEAIVFFDSGSQRSYITRNLIKKLRLPTVNHENLTVTGFGGKTSCYKSDLVHMKLKAEDGWHELFANSAERIVDRLPVIEKKLDGTFENSSVAPDILIGMDYYYEYVNDSKMIKRNLFLVESKIGKMYCGKIPMMDDNTVSSLVMDKAPERLDDCEMFWKLETMGIVDRSVDSVEDEKALKQFEESLKFQDNRYYISWPFKTDHPPLPSNAGYALARLRSNCKKIQQNPELMAQAQTNVEDQLNRGTIELAPKKPQGSIVCYLPHHFVITPQKSTTKIRMVFDGSAKASKNDPSLNDCMYRGPIDMPEIPGLLFKLRTSTILITGDIEKAFHQVYLNEEDRDAVRFFWVKDLTKEPVGNNLITYRFVGVPFGIKPSPSILSIIIKYHLKRKNIPALLKLLKTHFVDNLYFLEEKSIAAIAMFKLVREYFLEASMNVREWLSNDPIVNAAIPDDIRQTSHVTKVLGLTWDTQKDTLSIVLKHDALKEPWTKRKVLTFIASTYDPLGFLSPVTIRGRIFMQKLFQEELKWDDALNEALVNEWKKILDIWNGSIDVPRRYVRSKFPDSKDTEIHAFADASSFAYCAAVYLRVKTADGYVTSIVFAKTRLQPLKKNLTIPKMEVMGIWLAAKLVSYVQKELDLPQSQKFIWTDSQISWHWFQ
uniref:Peptidase aspartic putative domain-containing protein n=1 Tax=Panagrolaimus sp. ES5 TaxID=591445 RepID=A0AC34FGK2_9BILA